MHLRLLTIDRHAYRIVTLRPGTEIVFSTNFFHETWHIVTSQRGAHLLARLLWGLSFERHPGPCNAGPRRFRAEGLPSTPDPDLAIGHLSDESGLFSMKCLWWAER